MTVILPDWLPNRPGGSPGLRLLTRASNRAASRGQRLDQLHDAEWLCVNAGGSFALGTVDRCARRKYHGLLTVREPGVGEPLNLIAEVEEWFEVAGERFALHCYDWGDATEPEGVQHLVEFDPAPRWTYRLGDLAVTREVWLEDDADAVWVRYVVEGLRQPVKLRLRPLIRCRPLHGLSVANPFLNGQVEVRSSKPAEWSMRPYDSAPPLFASLHGVESTFETDGHWYEGVHYRWEKERGYEDTEDLFTPGEFCVELVEDGWFGVRFGTSQLRESAPHVPSGLSEENRSFVDELEVAADAYLARLKDGRTGVIAGYPWFGEWSRDALIALPGLCLERNRIDDALSILESLASRFENGLVPNIPKSGDVPANANAIDASLFFIRATALTAERTESDRVGPLQRASLDLVEAIFDGADPRVRVDDDGLLFVEDGPWALTWMDAMVGGEPVTARSGYAVDLNALWWSGLVSCTGWASVLRPDALPRLEETTKKLSQHFEEKFWLQTQGFLSDTHDGRHPDCRLRPNQLWALLSPGVAIDQVRKKRALQAVREKLLTPVGLRTLSPDDPDYRAHYRGDQAARDFAYHQGTVWPWLIGPYADAVAVVAGRAAVRDELLPVLASLCNHLRNEGCLGHIGEVFDGEPPHRPGGAPAQAWSVAEVLRVAKMVGP